MLLASTITPSKLAVWNYAIPLREGQPTLEEGLMMRGVFEHSDHKSQVVASLVMLQADRGQLAELAVVMNYHLGP